MVEYRILTGLNGNIADLLFKYPSLGKPIRENGNWVYRFLVPEDECEELDKILEPYIDDKITD